MSSQSGRFKYPSDTRKKIRGMKKFASVLDDVLEFKTNF